MAEVSTVEFVSIGQGRSVHAAFVYVTLSGKGVLGARCDRTGWANYKGGRKVRPVPNADKVTCKSCLKIMEEN